MTRIVHMACITRNTDAGNLQFDVAYYKNLNRRKETTRTHSKHMVGDQPTQLPGVADADSPDPIIVHVDMDYFSAAHERPRHPDLNGKPMVIGMGYKPENFPVAATTS